MATVLMAAYTNYRRDPRVKREAESLVEAGHRVVFLARRQPGEPDRETIAGVDVIKTPGLTNSRMSVAGYVIEYAIFCVAIALHLLRHPLRYQLVHINNMPDFLVFGAFLPRLLGRPVILDVHDLMPELYREKFGAGRSTRLIRLLEVQERWAGRFASAVLTVEDRLKTILSGRGIESDKIHVLMNLPNENIFRPRPSPPPKAADAPFVIVYHGTLARRLGLDVAIEAVARARDRIPRMELRIIGAGEERERLLELRERLGLQQTVTFSEGFVPVEQIPGLIADADIGLIPLRISGGTDIMLPTKLLEYVSMGIPCVTPRTGTIARYFDESMVQFFEAENVDSLADAIVSLQRDPQRRAGLAREATAKFGQKYRWSEHKKVYVQLVDRLIGNNA
jgi:glycosyltransferase involved in cell wall biosynthesis